MRDCRVDHPLIVAAFAELERAAQTLRIRAYDETKHEGDLRHVWAKTNGQEVILTLITAQEESEAVERLPSELSVAGLAVSVQSERGNGMRGRSARTLSGVSELYTKLAGHDVEMGALGFLQPNPAVIERAYLDLISHEGAPPGLAFDLYAGTGITTRLLRDRFAEVMPCEGQPESARALGIEAVSVETFLAQRLEEAERKPLALVIANPPRKGLGEPVCKMLLALAPEHLGIMSCGPAGLAADLATLAVDYRVTSLRAYDTLPQTPHVELVAKLVRK
jgi:tRNA/tmRNA/rRNA uracil-C5-methylase (TrmA/RlmC/RlmD family)